MIFDAVALFAALDQRRLAHGLSWKQVADEIWAMSAELTRRRQDHPISPSTLTGMARRRNTTCQHALFMLRWDLSALYWALESRRTERGLTWAQTARELRCTPNQLTGLRTARFATGIGLAMRIVQWLDAGAADFVIVSKW